MRIQAFLISEDLLLRFLSKGSWSFDIDSEIPVDATLHAIAIDPITASVRIVLRHDSFADVADGALIPIGKSPTITFTDCRDWPSAGNTVEDAKLAS